MRRQNLINELQGVEMNSIFLNGLVINSGGLFFVNDEQINLSTDQLNELHSELMTSELSELNEFKEGCFYEL